MSVSVTINETTRTVSVTVSNARGPAGPAGPAGTVIDSYASDIETLPDYPASFPPASHTHFSADITDASNAGRSVLQSASATAQRGLIFPYVTSGAYHNDFDAANADIAVGDIYRATDGSTKWRSETFHPMQLTPTLWLDASQLSLSNGAFVTSWTDLSGNSRTATPSGTAPTFETSGPNGMPWVVSAARTMLTPSFDHFPSKRGTWFIAYRPNASVSEKRLMGSFSGGTSPTWAIYNNNEFTDRYLYANAFGSSPARLQGDLAGEVIVRVIRRTSDTQWDWFRGPTKQWTATLADVSLASNQLRIGQQFEGRLGEILFYPSALSDSDVEKVAGYLTAKWASGRPLNLAFAGDSQTYGYGIDVINDQGTYPSKVFASINDGRAALFNEGVGGSRWVELTSRATTLDDRISKFAQNVLFVWCGTNEVGANDVAASAASADVYLAARKAAGWQHIVVLTAMDRIEGQNETWRTTYNTALRNLCSYHGYILADIAADARLGPAGAFSNTAYFNVDGIHINEGGTTVAAEIVIDAISSYI